MITAPTSILGKALYTAVGIILGIIACLAFFFFLVLDKGDTSQPETQTLNLIVSTPSENLATDKKTLTISGTTSIDSLVTINSPQTNTIVRTSNGNFSTKIDLLEGKNILNITAFDPKTGASQTETKEILYLDEDLSSL